MASTVAARVSASVVTIVSSQTRRACLSSSTRYSPSKRGGPSASRSRRPRGARKTQVFSCAWK